MSIRKKDMYVSPDIMWGKLDGIHRIIEKAAPTDITILIEGETGTGKGLVAKVIHALSSRCGQPFIPINCAALQDKLIEPGRLARLAFGGTLFLDEAGEMKPGFQAEILALLEEKDARVIAATKGDLEQATTAGRFDRKLFQRLCALKIKLPPLRERKEDIVPLAEYLAGRREAKISARAKRLLQFYNWPGNVRELQNCIDRALVMGDGKTIQPQDLPYPVRRCAKIIPAPLGPLRRMEEDYILRVLRYTKGDQRDAARILGITVAVLGEKIKKHRIKSQKWNEKTLHLSKK